MKFLLNRKLGINRGAKRLWLEGIKLQKNGFTPSTKIQMFINEKDRIITIKRDKNGEHTVSQRTRNDKTSPIIDICGKQIDLYKEDELLRIVLTPKSITVKPHERKLSQHSKINRIASRIKAGLPLKTLSLFHGGGVLDLSIHSGLKDSNINSVIDVAVELEKKYIDSSISNNSVLFDDDSTIIESPIELLSLNQDALDADIAVIGLPCLGASIAGKSKLKLKSAEDHDSAGAMFHYALNWCVNVPIIIIENVPQYLESTSFSVIANVLKSHGYKLQTTILAGNDYGALEDRKRMCCVAMLKELYEYFDIEMILDKSNKNTQTVSDILDEIKEDSTRWKTFDYLAAKEIRDKEAGKGFKRQMLDGSENRVAVIGRGYFKARSTEPFLKSPFDSSKSRLFTPIEHAKIKTVPLSLIEGLSDTCAHEILGQGVVFNCFRAVAKTIGDCLNNFCKSFDFENLKMTA